MRELFGLIIEPTDNVAVVLETAHCGDVVTARGAAGDHERVPCLDDTPAFHKIARKTIDVGQCVIKYGQFIGVATAHIKAGSHVHTHNCASSDTLREERPHEPTGRAGLMEQAAKKASGKVACNQTDQVIRDALGTSGAGAGGGGHKACGKNALSASVKPHMFQGFRRPDGSVGIRNHVLVLPTSICASDTTERIARAVDGCVTFHNQSGCSQVDADHQLTLTTLAGLAANPNVHSVLLVSLGCEGCQNGLVADAIRVRCEKPLETLVIQQVGGSIRAIERGIELARNLVAEAARCTRVPCDLSKLLLGTNCGGSDTTSGLGANPLIGLVSDEIVRAGGTSVLCETPELFGAEHLLARRCASSRVANKLLGIVRDYEAYVQRFGAEMRQGNPSPGNMAGGLTTLEEKSLGCVHKGGHSVINAVYPYAAKLAQGEGLVVMDTPGNDPSSMAGIIAGGCQLVLFSTGRGTPTGNAIAPILRLTANPHTARTMADNTDFDASETITHPERMTELRDKLIEQILAVCDGRKTRAEMIGYTETALPHLCNYM